MAPNGIKVCRTKSQHHSALENLTYEWAIVRTLLWILLYSIPQVLQVDWRFTTFYVCYFQKITRDLHGLNDTCTPFVSTDLNFLSFLCAWLLAAHGHTVKCEGSACWYILLVQSIFGKILLTCLPSWEVTYPLPASTFESMIFLFPWHMWSFPGYYCSNNCLGFLGFRFRGVSAVGPGKRPKKELLGRQSSCGWAMWVPSLGGRWVSFLPESGVC